MKPSNIFLLATYSPETIKTVRVPRMLERYVSFLNQNDILQTYNTTGNPTFIDVIVQSGSSELIISPKYKSLRQMHVSVNTKDENHNRFLIPSVDILKGNQGIHFHIKPNDDRFDPLGGLKNYQYIKLLYSVQKAKSSSQDP